MQVIAQMFISLVISVLAIMFYDEYRYSKHGRPKDSVKKNIKDMIDSGELVIVDDK